MDLFRPQVFFRPKAISKVAIIKTKSATITFFSSPPFFVFALSFSPFLFLRYCDFELLGLNPLNPNIKIQILICYPYTFSIEVVGRIC